MAALVVSLLALRVLGLQCHRHSNLANSPLHYFSRLELEYRGRARRSQEVPLMQRDDFAKALRCARADAHPEWRNRRDRHLAARPRFHPPVFQIGNSRPESPGFGPSGNATPIANPSWRNREMDRRAHHPRSSQEFTRLAASAFLHSSTEPYLSPCGNKFFAITVTSARKFAIEVVTNAISTELSNRNPLPADPDLHSIITI